MKHKIINIDGPLGYILPMRIALQISSCLFVILLTSSPAIAASGFAELRLSAMPGATGEQLQLVERLRPRFSAELSERLKLYTEVELLLAQGRDTATEFERILTSSDLAPMLEASGQSWPAYKNDTLRIDEAADYLEVARLYLDLYLPAVDLRIGRQSIYWGSAAMLNPTDPFPELLVNEPWRPRRGTNAMRANIPVGNTSDVTLVLGTNDTFNAFRAAGRMRTTVADADFALVAAYRGDDESTLVGLDIRGTLGVGYWLEAAVSSHDWEKPDVAVGVDYSFPVLDSLVIMAQYYRNGRGRADANPLSQLSPSAISLADDSDGAAFAPLLSGLNYAMVSINQIATPELSLSVAILTNLDDGSTMAIPTLSYLPLGWLQLALSAQVPASLWGDGGEFNPSTDALTMTQGDLSADLSGLVPDATITLWTRASF